MTLVSGSQVVVFIFVVVVYAVVYLLWHYLLPMTSGAMVFSVQFLIYVFLHLLSMCIRS